MLITHRASSGTALAHGLAEVLAVPAADPFAAEVVAVPAKGVERWLAQRLSHVLGTDAGDGVCANVEFPWPSTLVDEALQAASAEHAEAVERWAPARSVWPLLDVIDASVPGRAVVPVAGPAPGQRRRGQGTAARGRAAAGGHVRRVRPVAAGDAARLGGRPGRARRRHARSTTTSPGRPSCGAGCATRSARRARPSCSTTPARGCGTSRSSATCRTGSRSSAPAGSPPPGSRCSPPSPSTATCTCGCTTPRPRCGTPSRRRRPPLRRKDDTARRRLTNPLLTSLSRDVLELQQLIARCAPGSQTVLHESGRSTDTLLGRLKQDLADDRVQTDPPPLDSTDRSVQVHACHGRTRQVEVLREVIVGLLADDPTLEPRDVLVMCPDVETFAPIIAATFAIGAEDDAAHPAARLRVRLADRALRQTNALLAVLSQLLELGTARLTASQVLDLAGTPAVRQRFGFDDDELERLRDWTVGAGVRWGLDGEHRATWQLGDVEQGSWRDGLDRLLLGAAMEGALDSWGDVVPLDDVDSSDIDLAGRLAELVDRLAAAQTLMSGRHTAQDWMAGLEDAVSGLAATTYDTAWQLLQLRGELGDIAEAAEGSTALLGLADVRALLANSLAGRPTRASFRTGTLTVCTLVPMRSVPHRVVCLLGLDDGVFPRQSSQDGDDVLARDPWVGERDPRSEDRQLFLDAICAAEDHLVITYTGADERTGAPVPPAVPLGELLDALDRTASAPDAATGPRRSSPPTTRCSRSTRATSSPAGCCRAVVQLRPVVVRRGARRRRPARRAAAAVSTARSLPQPPPTSTSPTCAGCSPTRRAASCGSGCRWPRPAARTSPPTRCRSSWTTSSSGRSASGCCASGWPAWTSADCMALERHRGSLPPGPLGLAHLRDIGPKVESLLQASTLERDAPARVARRRRAAAGRHPARPAPSPTSAATPCSR